MIYRCDSRSIRFGSLACLIALALLAGCASTPKEAKTRWPSADVVPREQPSELDTEAATSLLRRGPEGYLYVVGGVPKKAKPGTPFIARYSGDWPLQDMARPPLAAGRIVRQLNNDVALVHLTYRMPETDIAGLEVTWEKSITADPIGKGLGYVSKSRSGDESTITLAVGRDPGVQPGDIYGLLSSPSEIDKPADVQLSRRFKGICVVEEAAERTARCQLRSADPEGAIRVRKGDPAVFLEHVMEKEPRTGVVQIGAVTGDGGSAGELQTTITEAFGAVLSDQSNANIRVSAVDTETEASRPDFHRVESKVEYSGYAQMFVGAEVVERNGVDHLIVNYTGIGPATGPGMIAAPPTGGVDLGRVDDLSEDAIRPFAGVVLSALLVYRGETAYALEYLHRLLSSPALKGPLRWHSRDQYAMRWGALGNDEEAMWLVDQDVAIAEKQEDRAARLNALGTRVRLYDFVGLTDRAVRAARAYLQEQESAKPGTEWLSALSMYAELQTAAGDFEKAGANVDKLVDACPEGCGGDLFAYLSSVWWTAPPDEGREFGKRILAKLTELGKAERGRSLAAVRLYQGVSAMREEEYDQALIAFLESGRIYEKLGVKEGLGRAHYFEMLAQLQREKNQNAYEAGQKALEIRREMRDFEGIARVYDRMSTLFANIDFRQRPGPYLRSARSVLTNSYKNQRARGSYGKAGESLYTLGSFMFKFGQSQSASVLFKRAVAFAISSTRFDVAALCHLHLAMVARRNNDKQEFREEIERAKLMAELAESPKIKEAIERALNPKKKKKDVPTQIL